MNCEKIIVVIIENTNCYNLCTEYKMNEKLREVRRISWIGIWVNLLLTVFKLFAGIFGHSTVLVADAINSFSDMVTDIVVLIGSKFWGRPADEDHQYGHAKIETIITLFIGVAVFLVGFGLVYGAVETLLEMSRGKKLASPTVLPFAVAIVSICVKQYFCLMTLRIGMRIKSSAVIANAWNHQSDVLATIPAVAAIGLCLLLGDEYAFLDPVGAVVVSFMIMYAGWVITRPTFGILLDRSTTTERHDEIKRVLLSFSEVHNFEKLRTRFLGPTGLAVDVHIRVEPQMSVLDAHDLTHKIKSRLLESDNDVIEVTIHVEPMYIDKQTEGLQNIRLR